MKLYQLPLNLPEGVLPITICQSCVDGQHIDFIDKKHFRDCKNVDQTYSAQCCCTFDPEIFPHIEEALKTKKGLVPYKD